MTRPRPHIGWYVGDGAGARSRLRAVLPHLGGARTTVLTAGPSPDLDDLDAGRLELPWSASCRDGQVRRSIADPADLDGAVAESLRRWVAGDRPGAVVVDGHAGVAALAGRLGISVVELRRPGVVSSRAPGSVAALAPYPAELEPPTTPARVRDRTLHVGLLSRFAGRDPDRSAGRRRLGMGDQERVVTVLCGGDGLGGAGDLAAAARATPGWSWLTVGRCGTPPTGMPPNLRRLGWSEDPWPALEAADVVVGSGSLAVVAEVASARRPLVLVPRPARLGDEAVIRALGDVGLATALTSWPAPPAWADVLAVARQQDPHRLARLDHARAPAWAAERLLAWARPTQRRIRPERAGHEVHRSASGSRRVIDVTDPRLPAAAGEG